MYVKFYRISITAIVIIVIIGSCTKEEIRNENKNTYSKSKIIVVPKQPSTLDEVFIVDTICNYDKLQMIEINDFQIKCSRSFNSMMKWPCFQEVDSISLGKLVPGKYTLIYFLIDKSKFVQDPIVGIDTLYFVVKN